MSCGKAIITTDIPNHREVMSGTRSTFLKPEQQVGICDEVQPIKVPTIQTVYGALKMMLENPEECRIQGIEGRKKAVEKYDLNKITVQWHNLIRNLVPQKFNQDTEMAKHSLNL